MKIFVAGTDTSVGKTTICAWLCLHTGFDYWKPIQTGTNVEASDSQTIASICPNTKIFEECFSFSAPLSPHLAAEAEGAEQIELDSIQLPKNTIDECRNLLVEGAGGLLVPLNWDGTMMIDLIAKLSIPVILVARSSLGTINHTLLSIEALLQRKIPILGVILNGKPNAENSKSIAIFGKTTILAQLDWLEENEEGNIGPSNESLSKIPLTDELKMIFFN